MYVHFVAIRASFIALAVRQYSVPTRIPESSPQADAIERAFGKMAVGHNFGHIANLPQHGPSAESRPSVTLEKG